MTLRLALDVLLIAGIVLFGVGYYWKDRRAHLVRLIGWAVFGAFWFIQVPSFLNQGDAVNSLGAAVALPVFLYLGSHEKRSYDWNEDYQPLRFLTVGAFYASLIYFAVDRIPPLSGALIEFVAQHTVFVLNGFAPGYFLGPTDYKGNVGWWRVNGEEIWTPVLAGRPDDPVVFIVLSCTAIQGIAITAALVPGTTDPPKRKALVLGILIPTTHVMNVVRNVVIIYFFDVKGEPFELVHGGVGKGLAFVVLIVLMLVAFWLLPDLYLNINGLFELPWRRSPGHDYEKHVGRLLGKLARPKAVERKLATEEQDVSEYPPKGR